MSFDLYGPWITQLEIDTVLDALQNGWYGPKKYWYVETFEAEYARYHGRKYGLMTPNCTTAIHLLLAGLGIGEGDEVIVPECTWIATAAPVTYQRAHTVFADIDPIHWCISPESLEAAITPRTKAVIVVDLFGNMPDMDRLSEIAGRRGIHFVEDSAEALGSSYKGIRAGKFGVGSVFSFHRTKTITTGEGGMLLLDDDKLYERCKFLRDHGRVEGRPYYNSEVTFKYMPFNLQAALGYAQLKRVDKLVERKRWILHGFKEHLSDIPDLLMNTESAQVENGAWCPSLVFGKSHGISKAQAIEGLDRQGLPARPFFYPLSSLPAFPGREEDGKRRNPVAYDVSARGISLPSALNMTEQDIRRYSDGIRRLLKR